MLNSSATKPTSSWPPPSLKTVLESARANTILINRRDPPRPRETYQLRGAVGPFYTSALAYLLVPAGHFALRRIAPNASPP